MARDDLQDLAERVAKLEETLSASRNVVVGAKNIANFALNERAFADRYIKGQSPEVRFAMVVAYLAKGDITQEVTVKDIQNLWGRGT